jgi:hypothetical protein
MGDLSWIGGVSDTICEEDFMINNNIMYHRVYSLAEELKH